METKVVSSPRLQALALLETALLHAYGDEPITDADDLPDELDELCALVSTLSEVAGLVRKLKAEVEAKTADTLGEGGRHNYGDFSVRYSKSYTYRATEEAADFITDAVEIDPELVTTLFNLNSMKKTGLESVAHTLGLPVEAVVDTVLFKKWGEPKLQFVPLTIVKEDSK